MQAEVQLQLVLSTTRGERAQLGVGEKGFDKVCHLILLGWQVERFLKGTL